MPPRRFPAYFEQVQRIQSQGTGLLPEELADPVAVDAQGILVMLEVRGVGSDNVGWWEGQQHRGTVVHGGGECRCPGWGEETMMEAQENGLPNWTGLYW